MERGDVASFAARHVRWLVIFHLRSHVWTRGGKLHHAGLGAGRRHVRQRARSERFGVRDVFRTPDVPGTGFFPEENDPFFIDPEAVFSLAVAQK